jgi:hypothetical protein
MNGGAYFAAVVSDLKAKRSFRGRRRRFPASRR